METVVISLNTLKQLVKRDLELSGYEAAGLDNWEGCDAVEFPTQEEIAAEVKRLTVA